MSPVFDPLNIILLAIAIIVFWRFKSVLGQRTGTERPPLDPAVFKPRAKQAAEPQPVDVEQVTEAGPAKPVWHGFAAEGSAVAKGLEAISVASPDFNVGKFVQGAQRAYEIVLEAYANGDRARLKNLLGPDVFESFASAIAAREAEGAKTVFKFVGITASDLQRAGLESKKSQITLRFSADMILATVASDGATKDGDTTKIRNVEDTWTFERDTTARDPNWKLVSTDDDLG
jgi:predicted lipid-binding transport protein (Tim44 family)